MQKYRNYKLSFNLGRFVRSELLERANSVLTLTLSNVNQSSKFSLAGMSITLQQNRDFLSYCKHV